MLKSQEWRPILAYPSVAVFVKWAIPCLFFFIFIFHIQLTVVKCFAKDWIQTDVLWYRKQPLYQLIHKHLPFCCCNPPIYDFKMALSIIPKQNCCWILLLCFIHPQSYQLYFSLFTSLSLCCVEIERVNPHTSDFVRIPRELFFQPTSPFLNITNEKLGRAWVRQERTGGGTRMASTQT